MNDYEIQKIKDTSFCSGYNTAVSKYEKQNKELQKENADLKEEINKIAFARGNLEEENAELKEELKKWKDEWQEQVQKVTDEGYERTLQTMQLTKAKEHIRTLISCLIDWVQEGDKDYCHIGEAEQFLNSEGK